MNIHASETDWRGRHELLRDIVAAYRLSTRVSAAVCCSPLLVRNALVFGSPMYALVDSFRSSSEKNVRKVIRVRKSHDPIWYAFNDVFYEAAGDEADESEPMPFRLKILYQMKFPSLNFMAFFFGNHTGVSWYPGYFEVLTLVLFKSINQDRYRSEFKNQNHRYAYMKDFDFPGYFWQGRLMFRTDPKQIRLFLFQLKAISISQYIPLSYAGGRVIIMGIFGNVVKGRRAACL